MIYKDGQVKFTLCFYFTVGTVSAFCLLILSYISTHGTGAWDTPPFVT